MSMLKRRLESARGSSLRCPFVRSASAMHTHVPWKTGSPAVQSSRAGVRVRVAEATTPNLRAGDVYVVEPKPLEEGVEKHIISIFVADEPGLINRVAGVFARRGANIESLAVGLTVDKALFTVVIAGKAATVANLVKQLSKLVKVRYVEDITATNRIERELLLLKLRVQPGPTRAEVLQLAQIFRARVVDVSDNTLSLSVTGDSGKLTALLKVMSKFGVVELARTGRICLRRGEALLERGTNLPEEAEAVAPPVKKTQGSAGSSGAPKSSSPATATATATKEAGFGSESESERTADVYAVDEDVSGVWDVDNVLAATYAAEGQVPSDYKSYTLNIEVQDVPGVLNQVTQVFARRGYNVQSLVVGPSEREGMSRIVMVVPGRAISPDGSSGISPLLKQLSKLVFVETITDLTDVPYVNRELLLVKVHCSAAQRGELRDLASIFRGAIVDVSANCLTIEVLGKEDKMKAFTELLEPYGILEIARTGRVAMARDSGVNSEYLERMSMGRVM